jgi:hypothetical protein
MLTGALDEGDGPADLDEMVRAALRRAGDAGLRREAADR